MRKTTIALLVIAAMAFAVPAQAVTNGGFESNFTGWTATSSAGGSFLIYSGTVGVAPGFKPLPAPPEGTHAVVTAENEPVAAAMVIHQTIHVPAQGGELSFRLFWKNSAKKWCHPKTIALDSGCNQQFRVDIIKSTADQFTLEPSDILNKIVSSGSHTDLKQNKYKRYTVGLGPWVNTDVTFRLLVLANKAGLNVGLDEVLQN